MAVIYLVRHAQAEDAGAGGRDHARPLDAAGAAAARRMGRDLRRRGVTPDLVLCSSACRARETWTALASELAAPPAAEIEEGLYLAAASSLLERMALLPDDCAAPLVIGHNPGLWQLLRLLVGEAAPETPAMLKPGLPPGAVAAVEVVDGWSGLAAGGGRLLWLVVPESAA